MKRMIPFAVGSVLLATALAANLQADPLPAGQVDFGPFTPPSGGGEFVEVNLTSSLISMATKLVEKQEPDIAQVLDGLKSVSVHVIGLSDQNRAEMEERTAKTRKELMAKGWERIVMARKDAQDVGIYLKTRNKDTVEGVVVMVLNKDKQAVFINIVGDIKPDKLSLLGERLGIDPLKKLGHPAEK
jgi:Domain of unknown function (DUF4252)